ncbi:oxidoreductase [Granulicella sp. dw_53]|uniref:oxidoreductase n=1 Tax=Granulicella sp. dw_53 TaxID=2719792 RepID=UPI001BD59D01|nr:oxidoreductase [Granulicella sp. dw_53]
MTTTSSIATPARTDRTWFITGTSTGFGRLLAEEVLKAGGKVIATARNQDQIIDLEQKYPDQAKTFALDVTDYPQIASVVAQSTASYGPIDVLVNNAGYGMAGAIEETAEDEFRPIFETNVFGLIRVTQALLPHFRARRSGHILNLSSIGGVVATPGGGMYNATKFAVEGLSEALAGELAPLGIHVTIIEPAPFRTDFLGRSGKRAALILPDYDATGGAQRRYYDTQNGKQKGNPLLAVHAIMSVVDSPNPPLRLLLGSVALQRLRNKLDSWQKEIATWEPITVGADFAEGE